MLSLVPISLRDANAFVLQHHRHDGKRARRARDVAERKRAFEELRTAAARWAKVAPLIANLHRAALVGASHTELIAAVAEVTAGAQEPTP